MNGKLSSRICATVLAFLMAFSAVQVPVYATSSESEINQVTEFADGVVNDGKVFGYEGYYNIISSKEYTLVPGAAIEKEIVLNNAQGNRRQVLHVIEVDPSNPDVSIVPGYYQIDKDLSWDKEFSGTPDSNPNWSHKELTPQSPQ